MRWLAAAPAHAACCPQESPRLGIRFSAAHFLWTIRLFMLAALWFKWGPETRARSVIFDRVARIFDRIATSIAPPSHRIGLLGRADRNQNYLMIGNRVRRMDSWGITEYEILDVDVVQRYAYV